MGQHRIRVYVLEDNHLVREALVEHLNAAPGIAVIGQGATAAEGLAGMLRLRPDVALLDVRLPDGSGIDVCAQVRSAAPAIKVLILTAVVDDDLSYAAMLAGASGCLTKQLRGLNLPRAVRQVAAGRRLFPSTDCARDRLTMSR